jgi:hypothetical protein
LPQGDPVQQGFAFRQIIATRQQFYQGCLAGVVFSDERDPLTRIENQIDVA